MKMPKILIADDDRDHLMMLGQMLRGHGYEVVSAFDARHAIQLAVEQNPEVLLLDIHMGLEDGYAVQEELRKISGVDEKPVIYITGDTSNWVHCIINGLGARAVLRKPFNQDELLRTLKTLLEAAPPENALTATPIA
jgi:two-component system alkaline phosphatase synthesis response regulator PhoP